MGQVLPVVSHVEPNLPAQDEILGHLVYDAEFTIKCSSPDLIDLPILKPAVASP